MNVREAKTTTLKPFLEAYHPMGAGGSLKGLKIGLAGYAEGDIQPRFVAVFVYPRSRWKHYNVTLELARLAWSPQAERSASTFLRKCMRILKQRNYTGLVVTYAMPKTPGVVYERAGFHHDGYSSGASWSVRGPKERKTPKTIGDGKKLKRFFGEI